VTYDGGMDESFFAREGLLQLGLLLALGGRGKVISFSSPCIYMINT